jgi:hypothetical protein
VGLFDNRKIVAVGAGDEFSLAVDESFQPWGWGRAEHGQLGFESRISRGGAESVKQSVFKPTIIDSLSELPDHSRPQRHQDSPSCEAPLLDIDLEWDLPDFATIGIRQCPHPAPWLLPNKCSCVEMPGLGRLGKHGNHLLSREAVATGSRVFVKIYS